jgi:hypothetical protein
MNTGERTCLSISSVLCQCAYKRLQALLRVATHSYIAVLSSGELMLIDPILKEKKTVVLPEALLSFGSSILRTLRILVTGKKVRNYINVH